MNRIDVDTDILRENIEKEVNWFEPVVNGLEFQVHLDSIEYCYFDERKELQYGLITLEEYFKEKREKELNKIL
jgi:hypothetical protein